MSKVFIIYFMFDKINTVNRHLSFLLSICQKNLISNQNLNSIINFETKYVPLNAVIIIENFCGLCEKYSKRYTLIRLIEICPKCLYKGVIFGMILMDILKAYDCLHPWSLYSKTRSQWFWPGSHEFSTATISQEKSNL